MATLGLCVHPGTHVKRISLVEDRPRWSIILVTLIYRHQRRVVIILTLLIWLPQSKALFTLICLNKRKSKRFMMVCYNKHVY
jgi:hypothetical protein